MSTSVKTIVGFVLVVVLALILWGFVSQLFGYAVLVLAAVGGFALIVAGLTMRRRGDKLPVGGRGGSAARQERSAQRELKHIERRIRKS